MAEGSPKAPIRYTLSAFIDEHSKLITAIGLFIALSALSTQIDDPGVKSLLPGIALLGALLLTLELFLNVPPVPEREFRLLIFELVLLGILVTVGKYWFDKFRVIWVPALFLLVMVFWLVAYWALLVFVFRTAFVALARRTKWDLRPRTLQVIWTSGLLLCVLLAGLGLRWTARHIPPHQLTSPAPQQLDKTTKSGSEMTEAFAPGTWPTWAAVAIGAVAAVIYFLTLRAIKKQTETNLIATNALIYSERAWVMARIEHSPLAGARYLGSRPPDYEDTTMSIRLWTKNEGKTPAWITEKRACFVIKDLDNPPLPDRPDVDSMEIIQPTPEPLAVGESTYLDVPLTSVSRQGLNQIGYIYGRVQYRDVFADNRETFFGYRVTLGDQFERLSSYPEYNKNT